VGGLAATARPLDLADAGLQSRRGNLGPRRRGRRRWHRGTREILSPANTASAPLPKAAAAAAAAVDADAIRHCQPTPGDYRTGN